MIDKTSHVGCAPLFFFFGGIWTSRLQIKQSIDRISVSIAGRKYAEPLPCKCHLILNLWKAPLLPRGAAKMKLNVE